MNSHGVSIEMNSGLNIVKHMQTKLVCIHISLKNRTKNMKDCFITLWNSIVGD